MSSVDAEFDGITLRRPQSIDGAPLHALIAACKPLDENSVYCNLLQCTHFSDTCIVAEKDGELVGFVSGYRPPGQPHVYFLWQVGVGEGGRGHGLATKMVDALLSRDDLADVVELNTTVTKSNKPSRALFARLAENWGAEMTEHDFFTDAHFEGTGHEPEYLFRIRPVFGRK